MDTKLMEDLINRDQSWEYIAIWQFDSPKSREYVNRKIKVEIRRNAYDAQSHVDAYLFDGDEWNFLVEVPFTKELKCFGVSYVDKADEVDIKRFRLDAESLLKRALQIIYR